ncbi:DUF86 domain-containing protein [Chloracidobacterium sp. MS 40/45]|uniref:HepT-like ribonuclease domain-containing protein n=1 Tax=Chloracidobacterium aggregatum TaxID=2851959 RepID=UPI001B8C8D67|nr:DUF86 domain-containing protein [Chloracidobacterium aggregatum]QUV99647.1 DUF86 domain-containing protein [Chloracidobacterium sp. MS 40/45]
MSRTLKDYLEDVWNTAGKALEFVEGMRLEEFIHDRKTANAVICSLEVMGEAAKKIPEDTRSRYPEVPWKEIAGMRDKLIHEYHGVDLQIIWKTVSQDIPPLLPVLERLARETLQ